MKHVIPLAVCPICSGRFLVVKFIPCRMRGYCSPECAGELRYYLAAPERIQ